MILLPIKVCEATDIKQPFSLPSNSVLVEFCKIMLQEFRNSSFSVMLIFRKNKGICSTTMFDS